MSNLLSVEEAAKLLRNTVKMSNIDNQKHIDLTLVSAEKRDEYQKALIVVQSAVARKEYTQAEINELIGI